MPKHWWTVGNCHFEEVWEEGSPRSHSNTFRDAEVAFSVSTAFLYAALDYDFPPPYNVGLLIWPIAIAYHSNMPTSSLSLFKVLACWLAFNEKCSWRGNPYTLKIKYWINSDFDFNELFSDRHVWCESSRQEYRVVQYIDTTFQANPSSVVSVTL